MAQFTALARDAFNTSVSNLVVCGDPKTLLHHLLAGNDTGPGAEKCHAVRATFATGMTVALAGTPQGLYAHYEVWLHEYNGSPDYVFGKNRDANSAFASWEAFEDTLELAADVDEQMRAVADDLLGDSYISSCKIGSTHFIQKPGKAICYRWE